MKKILIFESRDRCCDNSASLAQYIMNNSKKYAIYYVGTTKYNKNKYYLVNNRHYISTKQKLRFYFFSIKSYRIFFSFDNLWRYLNIKEKNKIIFLTHGEFPIKSVQKYYESMFLNSNNYVCLKGTHKLCGLMQKYYGFPNVQYIVAGQPRNDEIYSDLSAENVQKFKNQFIQGNKIILVCCTFRTFYAENNDFFANDFPIPMSYDQLRSINELLFRQRKKLVFKLHHAQFDSLNKSDYHSFSNILFFSSEELLDQRITNQILFRLSDAMITDFSNIFFGYLLVDKPIGFILNDYEAYKTKRGFTLDNPLDIMPGSKIYHYRDLLNFISFYDKNDEFRTQRHILKEDFLGNYKNNNCQDVCNKTDLKL